MARKVNLSELRQSAVVEARDPRRLARERRMREKKLSPHSIKLFFHCAQCTKDLEASSSQQSLREYGRLECGLTEHGFQIWCLRHNTNVAHVDLMGQTVEVQDDHERH